MLLCIGCDSECVPDPERQKLSAKIDRMNAALAKRRGKIYADLQSEDKELAASCSPTDSIAINRRIAELQDSIYECRKADEDIDVFWINNK